MQERVYEILKSLSGVDEVFETDKLREDLAIDSLGMVELLVEVESAFDIELEDSDINPEGLITVFDVICLVGKYIDINEV